jgi:hypothetical protein
MGGCYGGRDEIPAQESDMRFGGGSRGEEGDRMHIVVQEERSSIIKRWKKVQGSPNS